MNDVRVAAHQVRFEQKAYWRNPMAAVFTFAFPIVFLIVVGTTAGSSEVPTTTRKMTGKAKVKTAAIGFRQ